MVKVSRLTRGARASRRSARFPRSRRGTPHAALLVQQNKKLFRQYGLARLRERISFKCEMEGQTYHLPAGRVGVIVEIWGEHEAFWMEFAIRPPRFGPGGELLDTGTSAFATLLRHQLEPVG